MRGTGKPWGVFCLALARDRHASMAPTEASAMEDFVIKKPRGARLFRRAVVRTTRSFRRSSFSR